jgi:hypothetical protein
MSAPELKLYEARVVALLTKMRGIRAGIDARVGDDLENGDALTVHRKTRQLLGCMERELMSRLKRQRILAATQHA